MSLTRPILVATGFSPQARIAAKRGALLAEDRVPFQDRLS